jgi:hypothetical protein
VRERSWFGFNCFAELTVVGWKIGDLNADGSYNYQFDTYTGKMINWKRKIMENRGAITAEITGNWRKFLMIT